MLIGLSASGAEAQVDGRLVRVGLFAEAQPIVRSGNWSFAEVELSWGGDRPFDGELHVDQPDRDGDVVTAVLPVALPPDGEWHRFQVYFVPHDINRTNTVSVKLFDENGRLVKMRVETGEMVSELVSDPIYDVAADDFLVVDLTTPRKLDHVAWLDSGRLNRTEWWNARQVRGMSPGELPRRWQGLDAVDAIVWDNADPSELSQQQIRALVDWVKAGGRLLLTSSTKWKALKNSALADTLPVTITGVRKASEAQEFTEIVNNDEDEKELAKSHNQKPITRCQMQPLPIALPLPADCVNEQIVYRRLLGRGSITFVGASLRELDPAPDEIKPTLDDPFVRRCEDVVGRKFLGLAEVHEKTSSLVSMAVPTNLFRKVRDTVGFREVGGAFLIFAILFAITYTLAATFGSYWYLKRRCWEHQCWIAFALIGVVGSVIGTGMVWTLRGVTKKVWQTTIVDGQSGIDYGHATCLFGVKTPNHTNIDLRLPVGVDDDRSSGPLRVMPEEPSSDAVESRFVAPENYRLDVAHARLVGVPVRATLKQFHGRWHGSLGGTLDAKLVERRTGRSAIQYEFGPGSYIRNNLGVTLRDCYLLETEATVKNAMAGFRVHCFRLGDLPMAGPDSMLDDEQIRQRLFFEKAKGAQPGDPLVRIKSWPRLNDSINDWVAKLPGVRLNTTGRPQRTEPLRADEEYLSLLLLSTFSLADKDTLNGKLLHRSHGRSLDCSHWLSNRRAVLIGWSDEPSPAVLEIDGANHKPEKSLTIYRFAIPVERRKK